MVARIKAIDHRKVLRYSAVSFIAVPMTQIILLVFQYGFGWNGLEANTMAVAVTVVPVYVLNRYWVQAVTRTTSSPRSSCSGA